MALIIDLTFDPTLPDGMELKSVEHVVIPLTGKGAQYNKDVTTTDGTFSLASITALGYVKIKNRSMAVNITAPGYPTITVMGAVGISTWSYKIVALQTDGTYSAVGPVGTTTTGNATLDTANFNRLTWDLVLNAASYDIYRTASGGTPATLGKIGNTNLVLFDDTGLVGDTTTAPTVAADNLIFLSDDGVVYPLSLRGQEIFMGRWNAAAIHHKANTRTVPVDITMLD